MHSAAYRRVRLLLGQRAGRVAAAHAFSAVQALLLLLLLGVGGLLLDLIVSRGEVRLAPAQSSRVPRWLQGQVPVDPVGSFTIRNSGLYPVAARNEEAPNPFHAWFGRFVRSAIHSLMPLRSNQGALLALLAAALALILTLTLLDQARRAWTSEAVGLAATSLRHQLHRQVYRRGQSSLPSEGIGPVVDLFTKDVNEVRDGLLADLDLTVRMWVLGIGLLLVAMLISVQLTVFLGSLGCLVWLIVRPLNASARMQGDIASRASAVQLALLQEDLAMLRTVRVYGMEGVDKRRFDEHLESYRLNDDRRIRTEGRISPTAQLLGGAAAVIGSGLLGYAVLTDRPTRLSAAAAVVLTIALLALARPVSALLR